MDQRVRLGVIMNPNARYLQQNKGVRQITKALGAQRVVKTQSIGDLPRALEYLLQEQNSTVLGICGGDGTIHHTINALIQYCEEQQDADQEFSLPPVVLLRGGTLNIVARSTKVDGLPSLLLERFLQRFEHKTIHELPLKHVPVIAVRNASQPVRYGFVFGSEITATCLELYENRFGAGYLGLAKFLQACVKAYLFKDDIWQRFEPLLNKPVGTLVVGDRRITYQAVVSSTVDIKLLAGLITGMSLDAALPGSLLVRILTPQTPSRLLRNLPNLVFGRDGEGIENLGQVDSFRIEPAISYSFDGEVFDVPEEDGVLEVESPSWSIPVVAL